MPYKRGVLLLETADEDMLNALSCHAVVSGYYGVRQERYCPSDFPQIAETLVAGDGVFADTLHTLAATQEAVVQFLEELVIERDIRVFVLDESLDIVEIEPPLVRLMQDFRRLDIILIRRAA